MNIGFDYKKIMYLIDSKEEEYIENLSDLYQAEVQEKYIAKLLDKGIIDVYSLLDYYSSLKSNSDRLEFQNFAQSIIKDSYQTEKFFKELKNLTLLRRTGALLEYASIQVNYSKRIVGNFLLKLGHCMEQTKEMETYSKLENERKRIKKLRKYKNYFAPIGIVKEVKDSSKFNEFLNTLDLSKEERYNILLDTFKFNIMKHENKLKNYILDLQSNKDLVTTSLSFNENDVDKILLLEDKNKKRIIKRELKKLQSSKKVTDKDKYKKITNINNIDDKFLFIDIDQDETYLDKKDLINNSFEDSYKLFINYYNILLSKSKNKEDIEVIKKAKKYLDKKLNLVSHLNDISKKDLDDTLKVYTKDESLREEVYKTTENIDRLLAYEIKTIFDNVNLDETFDIEQIVKKLKPSIKYIEHLQNKN